MKLVCLRDNIKNSIALAERLVGKNISLPVLSNFFLATDKGMLRLSATDLELGIDIWTSCKIEQEGELLVPARLLGGLVNNLTEDKIIIETKDQSLMVRNKNNQTVLVGADPKEFPIIPNIKQGTKINLQAQPIREALLQVFNAAAVSSSRPELNSVFVKKTRNTVKIVATDTFRLAEKTIFLDQETSSKTADFSLLLPLRTVGELTRVLEGKDELVLNFDKNQLVCETKGIRLYSRLLEGIFPDYEQVLPKNFEADSVIDKQELVNNLRLAGLFAGKEGRVTLEVKKNNLTLKSSSSNQGQTSVSIESQVQGKELQVNFNHHYLLEGLSNLFGNKLLLRLNSNAAALIKSKEKDDYFYLTMPMRNI